MAIITNEKNSDVIIFQVNMNTYQPIFMDIGQGLSRMISLPAIASWDNKSRPKKVKVGTLGFNTQTNSLEYWDGSYWLEARME